MESFGHCLKIAISNQVKTTDYRQDKIGKDHEILSKICIESFENRLEVTLFKCFLKDFIQIS